MKVGIIHPYWVHIRIVYLGNVAVNVFRPQRFFRKFAKNNTKPVKENVHILVSL